MLTFNGEKTRIFHSDFHGECKIMNTETMEEISVPCEDLLAFAAEYVRSERINALEQMETGELLGIPKVYKSREIDCKHPTKNNSLNNYIIYGTAATGKTTKLIRMIKALLRANPELKIGVCEKEPEIKSDIPVILSVQKPSADLDLFVCTYDYHMIEVAYNMGIPVWCEICGDEKKIATATQNLPCLKDFENIKMNF